MQAILAVDVGTKRIGVAISGPLGATALPLETVQVEKGGAHYKRLKALVAEHEVETIVYGLPRNMDGSEGRMARKVRAFVAKLEKLTGCRMVEWDERLTSAAAGRAMDEGAVKRQRRKEVIDQLAASLILQGYLASL